MANLGLLMWNESTKDEAIIGHEVEFSLAVRGTPLVSHAAGQLGTWTAVNAH